MFHLTLYSRLTDTPQTSGFSIFTCTYIQVSEPTRLLYRTCRCVRIIIHGTLCNNKLTKPLQYFPVKEKGGFVSWDDWPLRAARPLSGPPPDLRRSLHVWTSPSSSPVWKESMGEWRDAHWGFQVLYTDSYCTIDRILCSPFSCPASQSLLCPAAGRLTPETVSTYWPLLMCAQIQSGGSSCWKTSSKLGRWAESSFLSSLM